MAESTEIIELLTEIRDLLRGLREDVDALTVTVVGPSSQSPTRKAIRTSKA